MSYTERITECKSCGFPHYRSSNQHPNLNWDWRLNSGDEIREFCSVCEIETTQLVVKFGHVAPVILPPIAKGVRG